MTATGSDHHVAVLLEDDIGAFIKIEHGDAVELCWGTAGFGHRLWVDKVHLWHRRNTKYILRESRGYRGNAFNQGSFEAYQSLHNSVIGGIHVGVQRKSTFSLTVICCVALWCYDPVLVRGFLSVC